MASQLRAINIASPASEPSLTDPEHAPRHRELPPVVRGAIALAMVLATGLLLLQADRARRGVAVTAAEVHGDAVPQTGLTAPVVTE